MRQTIKQFFAAVALAVIAASPLAAGGVKSQTPDRDGVVERELRKLDREWGEAHVRRDAAALDGLLVEDYTFTDSPDKVMTKAQEIARMKAPDSILTFTSIKTEEAEVRIFGEKATLTGRAALKACFDERDLRWSFRYVRTFGRREGRWQIVATRIITSTQDDQ